MLERQDKNLRWVALAWEETPPQERVGPAPPGSKEEAMMFVLCWVLMPLVLAFYVALVVHVSAH